MSNFESTREQLERYERRINETRARREEQERSEARRQREGLEKMSSSGGQRRSLVDILNNASRGRVAAEGGVDVISEIRKQQDLARAADVAPVGGGRARGRVPSDPEWFEPGIRPPKATEKVQTSANSNFDWGGNDPRQVGNSRFGHGEKYDPPRRVGIVPDSAGRLRGQAGPMVYALIAKAAELAQERDLTSELRLEQQARNVQAAKEARRAGRLH